ncbi:MAG: hypothetical protein LBT46_12170 [Planctomycetaceae bacterium]|jgi:hypothetical protein|nr:hypothetical protein [Planctomycetaceae bacterium]
MSAKKNYIPSRDADFDTFFKNLYQYVGERTGGNVPQWTFIPGTATSELNDAYSLWETAYAAVKMPHTSVETLAKNEAREAGEKVIRSFVNQYLRFPPVTDEDRLAMDIPNRDTSHTPVPPPTSQAEADILFPGIHLIELKIKPYSELAHNAASKSDHGVRVYFGVVGDATAADKFRLAAPPASGDDLPHSVFTRKQKYQFDFPEEDRGKTVYFCLRYENSKGESGPWGPILRANIP